MHIVIISFSSQDSGKIKGNTLLLMNEFKELHGSSFSLENGLRLQRFTYYETTMITSIENNTRLL
jgi:hypothetical protein